MIRQKPIVSTAWTPITTAGQNGSCWLDEDNDGAGGTVDVRIFNSSSGVPALSKATEGKRVYRPTGNMDIVEFTADSELDVYYAICKDSGATATLSVDTDS